MPEPKRRSLDVVTLGTLDVRVSSLEEGMHDVRRQIAGVGREIQAQARLLEETHGAVDAIQSDVKSLRTDTAGIIAGLKWISTLKRIAIAGSIAATAFCTAALSVLKLAHMLGWSFS